MSNDNFENQDDKVRICGIRRISPWVAFLPVLFLLITLTYAIVLLGQDPHIPIATSAIFAAAIAMIFYKVPWKTLESGIIDSIKMSASSIIILMIIGMIVGTWILSGIVPVMIYYGLKIISPNIFLLATLLITSIVSLATGSSWTTAGTVGVALMGIGTSLGVPVPVIGGAIISGAYFGDKMSPLSDTTNLAAAMSGTDLFDHIKHMMYTTVPAYVTSAVIFLIMGINYSGQLDVNLINEMNLAFESNFNLSPFLLIVPIIVIGMVVMKVPAIPGLFFGAFAGGIVAIFVQGATLKDMISSLHYGYVSETGVQYVDELLTRGGMDSMMWTVSLILMAMLYAGIMEKSGMLEVLATTVLRVARSVGSLVLATMLTSFGTNLLSGDQYLSIVLAGRMYKDAYARLGLKMNNLSRTLEDGGTITSPLIPWNTCGATMINTLGLSPWSYVPYCFFNLFNIAFAIIFANFGIGISRVRKTADE